MMTASEKVAYLKGLAEGLGIKDSTQEGKLMLAMIDVLESLAGDVEDLEANAADMADTIDDIGEDMAYLEDLCLGDMEDDEDDESDECDGECSCCGGCDDEIEYEVTCPKCGDVITVYEEDLDFGSVRCPKCDAELEFDFSEDEEDED